MKKIQIVVFAVLVIAFTAFNAKTALSSNQSYDLNTVTLAAMTGEDGEHSGENDPIIDGGEINGGSITCNTGGSGYCYAKRAEKKDGSYCKIFCKATGNTNDYCNAFWMGILEICVNSNL